MPVILYPVSYIESLDTYKYKDFCYNYSAIKEILIEEGYSESFTVKYLNKIRRKQK